MISKAVKLVADHVELLALLLLLLQFLSLKKHLELVTKIRAYDCGLGIGFEVFFVCKYTLN